MGIMDKLHILQTVALPAALRAGETIMEIYACPEDEWELERKGDNSPLTVADRRAHHIIFDQLSHTPFPVLSEEGMQEDYDVRRGWQTFWLIDPLDGTKEFLKRNGEFTVNIALITDGCPVAGVVYAPVLRRVYYGAVGIGAFVADVQKDAEGTQGLSSICSLRRSVTQGVSERPFTVVASRSHLSLETQTFIDVLRQTHPDLVTLQAGSSLKICRVAEGAADVYPRFAPTMEWDTAAGDAVLRAAGGTMLDAQSKTPLAYNKPDLHNPWFIAQ